MRYLKIVIRVIDVACGIGAIFGIISNVMSHNQQAWIWAVIAFLWIVIANVRLHLIR